VARLLTVTARLHARLAVGIVVLRMRLALVATHSADLHSGLEGGACHSRIEGGLAREHRAGRQAYVGTIAAGANAADHRLHLRLAEIGVGVGGEGATSVHSGGEGGAYLT
jgi:hypothetical protein